MQGHLHTTHKHVFSNFAQECLFWSPAPRQFQPAPYCSGWQPKGKGLCQGPSVLQHCPPWAQLGNLSDLWTARKSELLLNYTTSKLNTIVVVKCWILYPHLALQVCLTVCFSPTDWFACISQRMMDKQTHWYRWILHGHAEVFYFSGGRVEGVGETAQQVAHLVRHMSQGDHFARVSPGTDADGGPPDAARTVDPLGQLAEKEAARQLFVELAQGFLVLQEIPQTHAVLQQQTHKLRLVANQGWEHGPVEVTGLDGSKPVEHNEHPSRKLDCCLLFGEIEMACLSVKRLLAHLSVRCSFRLIVQFIYFYHSYYLFL